MPDGSLYSCAPQLPAVNVEQVSTVIQTCGPDRFFTRQQQQRLEELMNCWRLARTHGQKLSSPDEVELHALVEAEVEASRKRAAALS
jgi:hypothetical protein